MNKQILIKLLPYLALLIAHTIWGANFVVAKVTLQEFPPLTLAFLRFAFASILISPFFLVETKKVKIDLKDLPKLILTGILIISLNITFFFEGITRTTAINASVLTLIIPLLSVFISWQFLKEKISFINLVGIITGFVGTLILIQIPQYFFGFFSPVEFLGNVLIILASIVWVWGSVVSRSLLQKYPSLIVTGISFAVGTISFLAPAIQEYRQNPHWINQISILGIIGLVYMVFLSSISAYFLFEWGLAKTSVNQANLFQYLEPVVASFFAILLLGEKITPPFIVGIALIVTGVYLGTLFKEKHHNYKPHRI